MKLSEEGIRAANSASYAHCARIEGGRRRGTPMRCLCECGAVFVDIDGGPDADSQWHLHCTEVEIRAYLAVTTPPSWSTHETRLAVKHWADTQIDLRPISYYAADELLKVAQAAFV